jgi:hypothetical protein
MSVLGHLPIIRRVLFAACVAAPCMTSVSVFAQNVGTQAPMSASLQAQAAVIADGQAPTPSAMPQSSAGPAAIGDSAKRTGAYVQPGFVRDSVVAKFIGLPIPPCFNDGRDSYGTICVHLDATDYARYIASVEEQSRFAHAITGAVVNPSTRYNFGVHPSIEAMGIIGNQVQAPHVRDFLRMLEGRQKSLVNSPENFVTQQLDGSSAPTVVSSQVTLACSGNTPHLVTSESASLNGERSLSYTCTR